MILNRLLVIALVLLCGIPAVANHVLGGNITWNCLGGNQYQITLTMYKDCYGNAGDPATEAFFFYPSGCAATPFSIDLPYVSATEISDLCPTEFPNSSCSGGLNPGTSQVIYSGTVTLTAGCTWKVIWNNGDWNYFQNMSPFDGMGFPLDAYIQTEINTNLACANSIDINSTLASPQIQYVCLGQNFCHQISVANPGGLTLTYTLQQVQTTGATINSTIPMPSQTAPTGLTVSATGLVCWPSPGPSLGNYAFVVKIDMYSGGNYVGSVYENMCFVVRNCSPTVTTFSNPPITAVGSNTTQLTGTSVEVCAGDLAEFSVTANNSDLFRSIDLTFTVSPALPALTMSESGLNPRVGAFSVATTSAMANNTYTITVTAIDDACPIPDTATTQITLSVRPNVILNNDTTICEGTSLTLQAIGLNNPANYSWTIVSGDLTPGLTPGVATQNVTPDQTTVYRVTGIGVPLQCQSFDEMTVTVPLSDITEVITGETCGNNNGAIDITIVGPGSGNYNIDWTGPPGYGTDGVQDQTNLNGGNYSVTITDNVFNCSITENYVVGDSPAPTATFSPATSTICAGDSVALTLDFTPNGGVYDFVMSPVIPGLDITDVSDPYTFYVHPNTSTIYNVTSITDASGCQATVNLTSNITIRPVITGDFIQEAAVCGNTNICIEIDYDTPFVGPYTVAYSINNVLPATVVNNINDLGQVFCHTPTAPSTTYDIEYIQYATAPFCPSTDLANPAMTVSVNPAPSVTIAGADTICVGGNATLTVTATGTGPFTVNYTLNSVAQTPLNFAGPSTTINVTNAVAGTYNYCITSVQDANCTTSGLNLCAQLYVSPIPVPVFTVNDTELCSGQSAILQLAVPSPSTGATTFCASFSDTPEGTTVPDTYICSQPTGVPFTYSVTPTQSTTYTLTSVYFENAPACAASPNTAILVNVNDTINVVAGVPACNNTSTQYTVTFTLSGGEQPYDVVVGANPAIPINATTWTSGNVNSGSAQTWTFTDINDCDTDVITINHTCPVTSNAGTPAGAALQLCGTANATAVFNGVVLDGNDDQMFILCTDPSPLADVLATQVASNNTTAQFGPPPGVTYGSTYYIVSVVGDGNGLGGVNTGAPSQYVVISPGLAVTWYQTPTATITAQNNDNSACQGESVTLSVDFTGTGPWSYTYSLNNGPSIPGPGSPTLNDPQTFTVTTAGTYSLLTVSSGPNNLCPGTVSGSVNVVINPLPTAVWSANASTCSGIDHDFTITLTGATPFDLVIDNPVGANTSLTDVASPLTYSAGDAGTYDVLTVTDNNGCVSTADFAAATLSVLSLPTVQWAEASALFCQGANVDLHVSLTGASPFSIDITSPDADILNPTNNVINGQTFTVNVEGDYIINSVTDNNGCESTTGDNVLVDQIDTPTATAGPDQEQCVGVDVIIGTTPAAAGVSYAWTAAPSSAIVGSTTSSQATVNSATATTTTYTVTVTTNQGSCTATDNVVVTYHDYPALNITATLDSVCAAGCTSITASGADQYDWNPGNGAQAPFNAATLNACPDSTGYFVVTATDVFGALTCASTDSIQIFVGEPINVVEDFTAEVCFGTCDGEIDLDITGGFSPYVVSGDIFTNDTIGLCPGVYVYEVTDAIGCTYGGGAIEIEERAPEFIDQIILTNPLCDYDTGSIQVFDNTTSISVVALNGCSSYNVTQDGPLATFDGLAACEYLITTVFPVADGFCTTDSIVELEIISPDITFNPVWTEDIFCFDIPACFEGNPTGGTGQPDVQWYYDAELTQFASTDNPFCINISQDSTLYGVAIDQVGCYSDTVMVVANANPLITLDLQSGLDSVNVCEYSCLDLIAVVGGGNGNLSLEWYQLPFDQAVLGTDPTYEVCPLEDTEYMVIASDGCSQDVMDTVLVHIWDTPEVAFSVDVTEGCFPLTVTFTDNSIPILDDVSCLWSFGEGTSLGVCDTVEFIYNIPQLYAEYFPSLTITSENGCVGTDTLDAPIIIHGYPEIDFFWEPQPVTVLEHEVQFFNLSEGAETYEWNFARLGGSEDVNPVFDFPIVDNGTFPVCLVATTEYGCADTLCKDVFMESILQVFVPNVFTPDEDNINDVFLPIITGERPGTYRLWIFNRWGDPLFYTENPDQAWTGGSDGGGYYVNQETYVWRIEVEALSDGRIEVYEGTVTLLR